MSVLWGNQYPCFGLLVTSALVSKSGWTPLLACIILRFTSGVTPADFLAAELFHPRTCVQALDGLESSVEF